MSEEHQRKIGLEYLDWFIPFNQVYSGDFRRGNISQYLQGRLNACYNCVDRWVKTKPEHTAVIQEGDEIEQTRKISFKELHEQVCRLSNVLKNVAKVQKGDYVCIYMPMVPEAVFAMLACARIGAIHSVVFGGFSSNALRERIIDCHSKIILTADKSVRGGKTYKLKDIVDEALNIKECSFVEKIFVQLRDENSYENLGDSTIIRSERDVNLNRAMRIERPYCPCVQQDSEDPLFVLYTSGSTGKPKGILHTTAGYLAQAGYTHKTVFDIRPNEDKFACVADIGQITGHTYVVYGPLINGTTTFLFESTPLYPNPGRYWNMVERHKLTQFYTSPTAIRALQRHKNLFVTKYNLSSLRVLGTVGEPLNPEAQHQFRSVVGNNSIPLVDTYQQTETGGIILSPLPKNNNLVAGSVFNPLPHIEAVILDPNNGKIIEGDCEGVLCITKPWPGMARTILNSHPRYMNGYFNPYPGYYFTGDGAKRVNGVYFITGRVDDVLNISGHRIGTAEVESAIAKHEMIVESAVVAIPHSVKGQTMFAFVVSKINNNNHNAKVNDESYDNDFCMVTKENCSDNQKRDLNSNVLIGEIQSVVKSEIGAFASVEHIVLVNGLPKTRSGKIMRRLLRKIACCETQSLGDCSTLADDSVVHEIKNVVGKYWKNHSTT